MPLRVRVAADRLCACAFLTRTGVFVTLRIREQSKERAFWEGRTEAAPGLRVLRNGEAMALPVGALGASHFSQPFWFLGRPCSLSLPPSQPLGGSRVSAPTRKPWPSGGRKARTLVQVGAERPEGCLLGFSAAQRLPGGRAVGLRWPTAVRVMTVAPHGLGEVT